MLDTGDLGWLRQRVSAIPVALLVVILEAGGSLAQEVSFKPIDWPARQPRFITLEADGWVPSFHAPLRDQKPEESASWFSPSPLGLLESPSASFLSSNQPQTTSSTIASKPIANSEPSGISPSSAHVSSETRLAKRGQFLSRGRAVWYELPGNTANGESYNPNGFTAGHRSLPFGSKVRVVNDKTGQSVVVRINDRGPAKRQFVIDLSRASARSLGISGTATVSLYLVEPAQAVKTPTRTSSR